MAVKAVLRIGDPQLRRVAIKVDSFDTTELHELIHDMYDTMAATNGAGLAAPQIGVNKRVVVFGVESNPRYPDAEPVPMTVLINPWIEPTSIHKAGNWEGCLSVPGMRGYVSRYSDIRYFGYDVFGNQIGVEAHGFHALVVQHEIDHLDGILYPDRITNFTKFGFIEELVASDAIPPVPSE